jgi:hypothetical protein
LSACRSATLFLNNGRCLLIARSSTHEAGFAQKRLRFTP